MCVTGVVYVIKSLRYSPRPVPVDVAAINEFGRIDAESERLLAEFFIETDAYARIEDQEHIVVVGRKGTGKTAIYQVLLERADSLTDVFASGLKFRDYPWGIHEQVKDTDAAPVERYTHSWVFLILVELAKLVLTDASRDFPPSSDASKAQAALAKFINNNWGDVRFEFRDIFRKKLYQFEFNPQFSGTSLGSVRRHTVERGELASKLVEANRWLKSCLERILDSENWYFVLFDELDAGYDPSDEEYGYRLTGLLLAAREVFQWAKDNNFAAAPIVFLRSDIYDELSFPDKNKITRNLVETLTWTDELSGENSLKALIDQRIRVLTKTTATDPWAEVFDSEVMRGTQHKAKHLAARTYLRPRDMIQFCNLCLNEAKTAELSLIDNEAIARARRPYSDYLIQELDDEIHATLPGWEKYLDVLRRIHKMRFSREEFLAAFKALRYDRGGTDVDAVLAALYRYGIVGFTKIGGGGYGGSAVAFAYKDATISFDPAAKAFTVHPGLKEALELVESSESQ
jgi:hypothetical protein